MKARPLVQGRIMASLSYWTSLEESLRMLKPSIGLGFVMRYWSVDVVVALSLLCCCFDQCLERMV